MQTKNSKNKLIVFSSDDKKFPVLQFLDVLKQDFDIVCFQDLKFHKKFKEYCYNNQIQYLADYNTERLTDLIDKQSVKVGVVLSFNKILKQATIELFEKGLINAHPSSLPALRGRTPVESTILLNIEHLGFTTMLLDNHMDTGPVLSQYTFRRADNNLINTLDCYKFIGSNCSQLFKETILNYLDNKIIPKTQKGTTSISLAIAQKRINLQEVQQSCDVLYRIINASDIEPRSFIRYKHLELLINKVNKVTNVDISPDTKIQILGKKLYLKADDGVLEILEIQPKNAKLMSATDFLNGYARQLL